MTNKPPARFTFLLDPELKQRFEELCAEQDITPSQLMRQMIKAHLSEQGAALPAQGKQAGRHHKK
jgi:predicted transcriptional regulator